ncbi:MAG: copper resistance protein CopC [Ilumatobacteraceae bacterium]|nr:copper resistance protein CopC [Ilumatobacteraceae bacterium]
MRRWGRLAFAGLVAGFVVLAAPGAVSAHADLATSDPPAESVFDVAPTEIVLTFTEAVDPTEDALRVVDAEGTAVPLGPITQDLGADTISAPITESLADGSYVVVWSAVSADSHPINGAFVFSVGATSGEVDELIVDLSDADATGAVSSGTWLGAGRFASYAGMAVLVGVLGASALLAPGCLPSRRVGNVAFIGAYIAMAGTVVMIGAQAHVIGSSFADWAAVADTRSGRWWVLRLMLVAALTILVPWRHTLVRRATRAVAVVAVTGLFGVVAAGGHSMSSRYVAVALAATVGHLGAMALWIGGLCLVVFGVERNQTVSTAVRFSPFALGAVVALAITGAFNGWRQVGDIGAITESSYGRWLIVKLVVVTIVVTAAVVARRLVRHPAALSEPAPATLESVGAAAPVPIGSVVRRTVSVEVAGMVLVLIATAGLTGATPPRQATAVDAVDVTVTAVRDDLSVQIDLLPSVTGGTTMHVTIFSADGVGEPADEITVTAELADQQVGPIEIPTVPAGPNHVTTNEANFPLPGKWTLIVTARFGEFDQVVFVAEVDVTAP